MKKHLLFLCGWLLLGLASLGVFLPVLPTTPFVILAAVCFSSSSPRTHRFLLNNRFFGPYIENYQTRQGISIGAKVRAIACLWLLLSISALMMARWWSILLFAVVGIGVTIHLVMIKTKRVPPLPAPPGEQDIAQS